MTRHANVDDARIREAVVSDKGKAMAAALDAAREKEMTALFAEWARQDVSLLASLLRRLADDALRFTRKAGRRED